MGSQFRQLVEPALAEWDFQPIRQVWRDRLQQEATPRRELILACEGSGRVRDEQALPALLSIVHAAQRPRDVRLSAAKAAGQIADRGLESNVQKLLAEDSPPLIQRLCAVALLQRHDSEQARELLRKMFDDPAGPVAISAVARLYAIDPALVLELVSRAWEHPDSNVRRVAADCLIDLATPERIETLAFHLKDPNPALRHRIREALLEFAQRPEFEPVVRESTVEVLNSDDWRGHEQACLILGQLDQEAVALRLVELLRSERPEVQIASAWALRKVAVKDVLPAMLEQAQHQTDDPQGTDLAAIDRQVAHLFEAMTIMEYRRAIPLMRRHVPKEITHRRLCRGAAVWGLGYLLADANDEELAAQLMGRVRDLGGPNEEPEIGIVRYMSAISLGRMKAVSQLERLKAFAGTEVSYHPVDEAIRWAIREMSGIELPYRDEPPYIPRTWRIQPAIPE
jgi:HEAT repeat protein